MVKIEFASLETRNLQGIKVFRQKPKPNPPCIPPTPSCMAEIRNPALSKKELAEAKQILSPKNSFAKTSSALFRHLTEYLEGRTPKKNVLSFLEEIGRAQIRKARNIFLWCPPYSAGGGADSFVQFPLEKSSSKVYNYSTRSNLFGIKNMERFCRSQNRALIFAKTLSAYGGSREIP